MTPRCHYFDGVDDTDLLDRLRSGDEKAFRQLVTQNHRSMVRVARYYVGSDTSAEDCVQETWLAVIRGIDRFEGRSSLKTWLFHIVANQARTLARREGRVVPTDFTDDSVTVNRALFDENGMWRDPPTASRKSVKEVVADANFVARVKKAIDLLAEPLRTVVTLRDVDGLSTNEVAKILELNEGNVRVILHRGRARVRNTVQDHHEGGAT